MIINLYEAVKAHPEHFRQLSCRQLLFTQYDCPQADRMQDLYSQTSFISYVISGRRVFHQPGYSIEMTAGKCAFALKGGWLAEKEPAEGWCVLVFFIPDDYLCQFIKEYRTSLRNIPAASSASRQMMELEVNTTTESFFHAMIPYFTQDPAPPEKLLELKFRELLFNLLINPGNSDFLAYAYQLESNGKVSLQEIMEANFTYNLSLTEFAKIAHRSLAAFKRDFTQLFKTSPGKWLLQKRLDHAAQLLSTSSKPVQEIAFESGFENATHFSRVFRQKHGLAPLQFRSNHFAPANPR
jgi:AraC-like DNA-binding protein